MSRKYACKVHFYALKFYVTSRFINISLTFLDNLQKRSKPLPHPPSFIVWLFGHSTDKTLLMFV